MKRMEIGKYHSRKIAVTALIAFALALALPITATAQTVKLNVKDSTGTEKFVVTDSGYVGIGTNNPVNAAIQVVGPNTITTQIRSHVINSTPPTTGNLDTGGGFATYFNYPNYGLPLAGDRLGYYLFGAFDTDGITGRNTAAIAAKVEQNWVSGLNGSTLSAPSYLTLETTDVSGARSERVRVTASGNVGVGISGPTQKLEVNGGMRLNTGSAQPNCDSNTRGTFWVTQGAAGVKDGVEVCAKDAADAYAWRQIY